MILNQPAGHLEARESLIKAVIRETQKEIMARQDDFHSPLVLDCLNDYLNGQRYPLTLLHN